MTVIETRFALIRCVVAVLPAVASFKTLDACTTVVSRRRGRGRSITTARRVPAQLVVKRPLVAARLAHTTLVDTLRVTVTVLGPSCLVVQAAAAAVVLGRLRSTKASVERTLRLVLRVVVETVLAVLGCLAALLVALVALARLDASAAVVSRRRGRGRSITTACRVPAQLVVKRPLVAARLAHTTLVDTLRVTVTVFGPSCLVVQAAAAAVVLGRLRSTKASVERTLCLVLRVVVETVLAVLGCLAALLVALVALAGLDASTAVVSRRGGRGRGITTARRVPAQLVVKRPLVAARLAHTTLVDTLRVTVTVLGPSCLVVQAAAAVVVLGRLRSTKASVERTLRLVLRVVVETVLAVLGCLAALLVALVALAGLDASAAVVSRRRGRGRSITTARRVPAQLVVKRPLVAARLAHTTLVDTLHVTFTVLGPSCLVVQAAAAAVVLGRLRSTKASVERTLRLVLRVVVETVLAVLGCLAALLVALVALAGLDASAAVVSRRGGRGRSITTARRVPAQLVVKRPLVAARLAHTTLVDTLRVTVTVLGPSCLVVQAAAAAVVLGRLRSTKASVERTLRLVLRVVVETVLAVLGCLAALLVALVALAGLDASAAVVSRRGGSRGITTARRVPAQLVVKRPLVAARLAHTTLVATLRVTVTVFGPSCLVVQAAAAAVVLGRLRSTKASVERTLCLVLRVVVETVLAVLGCLAALLVALVALAGLDASTAVVSRRGGRGRGITTACRVPAQLVVKRPLVAARLAHTTLVDTLRVTVTVLGPSCLVVQAAAAAVVLGRLRSTKASVERTLCLVLRVVVETVLAVLGCLAALLVALVALAGLDASAAVVSRRGGRGRSITTARRVPAQLVVKRPLVAARLAHTTLVDTLRVTVTVPRPLLPCCPSSCSSCRPWQAQEHKSKCRTHTPSGSSCRR